jgi:hypothetical protein
VLGIFGSHTESRNRNGGVDKFDVRYSQGANRAEGCRAWSRRTIQPDAGGAVAVRMIEIGGSIDAFPDSGTENGP